MEFMKYYDDGGQPPQGQGQSGAESASAGRMSAVTTAMATSKEGEEGALEKVAGGTSGGARGCGDEKPKVGGSPAVGGIAEMGGTPESGGIPLSGRTPKSGNKRRKREKAEAEPSGPGQDPAFSSPVGPPPSSSLTPADVSGPDPDEEEPVTGSDETVVAKASPGSGATPGTDTVVGCHPLQIPLVLETIFQHCPARTLARCRLVCKHWRNLSLGPWRAVIPINSWMKGRSIIVAGKPLLEFLNLVEDRANGFGRKPYRNMSLDHWNFCSRNVQTDRFWTLVGTNLTSLRLFKCTFDNVDQFRQLMFLACPSLKDLTVTYTFFEGGAVLADKQEGREYKEPGCGEQKNLKSLSLSMGAHCDRGKTIPISWLELLSHFPSLTSLKISFIECDTDGEEFGKIMNAFRIIREEDDGKLPVRELELDPTLEFTLESSSHDNLFILQQQKLPLRSLKIRVQPDMDDTVLNNILNFHRMSLTKLELVKNNFRRTLQSQYFSNWTLPCYVKLECLQELEVTHVLHETMEFLKAAPNLRKLKIYMGYDFKNGTTTFLNRLRKGQELAELRMLALRELHATFECTRLALDELRRLGQLMPNLEKLTMTLSDMQFGVVCEQWTGLKELWVHGTELSDKGVVGGGMTGKAGPSGRSGAKKTKTVRGDITGLQGLKTFSFESNKLTDESVFNGFLRLPELQRLNAAIWPKKLKFGMKAKKALKARKIQLDGLD